MSLPQIPPSPLTSVKEPIGHPNWVYELKHGGFRGILYVDREQAWLVSRKGKKFHQFDPLLKQVLRFLKGLLLTNVNSPFVPKAGEASAVPFSDFSGGVLPGSLIADVTSPSHSQSGDVSFRDRE